MKHIVAAAIAAIVMVVPVPTSAQDEMFRWCAVFESPVEYTTTVSLMNQLEDGIDQFSLVDIILGDCAPLEEDAVAEPLSVIDYDTYQQRIEGYGDRVTAQMKSMLKSQQYGSGMRRVATITDQTLTWMRENAPDSCFSDEWEEAEGRLSTIKQRFDKASRQWTSRNYRAAVKTVRSATTAYKSFTNWYSGQYASDCL